MNRAVRSFVIVEEGGGGKRGWTTTKNKTLPQTS